MPAPTTGLTALAVDVALVGAVVFVPLTALSHAMLEVVAFLVGVVVATVNLAVPLAWRGRTPGQSLVGLSVLALRTQGRLSLPRALLRSLIVVLEVVGVPTFVFALPAVVELIALNGSGYTLADRLLRTSVVSRP